jgi:geranylgeranyl reductase family protein
VEQCEVLIVGGGPAGSTLAWRLQNEGLDVRVWDKARFPRDKTCAGWVTPAVVRSLQLNLEDYAKVRTLQPIHGFRIAHMGGRAVETHYGASPVSYGIRRCEFDHYLLQRSGAPAFLGRPISTIERDRDGWVVNNELRTRLLVGAGGHFCPVARHLGARLGRREMVVAAQEAEFFIPESLASDITVRADVPELFFCADLKGYGWVFRKGNYLNVGLGREDNHRLSNRVAEFCEYLRSEQRITAQIPDEFKGHAYLLYPHSARQIVVDNALLIGDAAGLAYAQSGEGIRPAIESALLAAQTILEAAGAYSFANLAPYRNAVVERFGQRAAAAPSVQKASWLKLNTARKLLQTQWFARHVVIDRWFLHRRVPALSS